MLSEGAVVKLSRPRRKVASGGNEFVVRRHYHYLLWIVMLWMSLHRETVVFLVVECALRSGGIVRPVSLTTSVLWIVMLLVSLHRETFGVMVVECALNSVGIVRHIFVNDKCGVQAMLRPS